MTRRILIELALFMIPFLVFFMYRAASKNMSVKDRWPLMWLVIAGGVIAGGGLIIKALSHPSDKGLCLQAARYENRVFIPAQKVPCDEVITPRSSGATSAAGADSESGETLKSTARKLPTVMEPETSSSEDSEETGPDGN